MLESLARFILQLILPSSQLLILLVIIAVLILIGWHRRAWQAGIVWIVLFLVYATPFLSGIMIDRLQHTWPVLTTERMYEFGLLPAGPDESGMQNSGQSGDLRAGPAGSGEDVEDADLPPDSLPDTVQADTVHIIILASSHTPDERLEPTQMLSDASVQRLVEGLRLYRQIPGARLITSGHYAYGEYSQAEATRDALISLGVDPGHIRIQPEAGSTCEEARAFVREHGDGARIIISTSALHMRRAMMIFEQQGARPVAAPAAFIRKQKPEDPVRPSKWLPSFNNISELESAINEHIGYVWNRRQCR